MADRNTVFVNAGVNRDPRPCVISQVTGLAVSYAGSIGIALSAGTEMASSDTVVMSNSNGISFGMSSSTITAQAALRLSASSNTVLTQTGTIDINSFVVRGVGGVSVGYSAGELVLSGATGGGGGGGGGIAMSAGTNSTATGTVVLSNANGISFGMETNAVIIANHALQYTSNTSAITSNALHSTARRISNIVVATDSTGGGTASLASDVSFSNANGISFYSSAGNAVVARHNGLTTQSNQSLVGFAVGNTTNDSTANMTLTRLYVSGDGIVSVGFSNNTIVVSATGGGGGAGDGYNFVAVTNSTANSTARVLFQNSNGITFGMSGSNSATVSITASHNGLTSQSNQAFSAGAASSAFQTLSFQDSNGLSFSNNAGAVRMTHDLQFTSATSAITSNALHSSAAAWSVSATNDVGTVRRVHFGTGNGITFGLSTGANSLHTITASHNGLTSQSNQAFSAGAASSAFQTLVFQDSNGVSWSNNAGSLRVTHDLQYTSNTSAITANALHSTASRVYQLVLATNSTGGGTASLSQNVYLGNTNGITFYTSANGASSSVIASHNGITSQTNQTLGLYATSNTTGASSSTTFDARSITFQGAGIASVGYSNGSIVVSVPSGGGAGDGVNILAAGGSTANTTGTIVFSDSAGVSFGLYSTSRITAQVSQATLSNSNSVTFGVAGGVITASISALHAGISNIGNTDGTNGLFSNRYVFSGSDYIRLYQATDASGATLGISNMLRTATTVQPVSSASAIGTQSSNFALADHAHEGVNSVGVAGNTSGNTSQGPGSIVLAGGNGITANGATAGGGMTVSFDMPPFLSIWRNGSVVHPANNAQANSLVSVMPFGVPWPLVASNVKVGASINVGTAANNSSAYLDVSVTGVLYSRNVSTLSSILSGSTTYTATWSSNATGSITGAQQFVFTHGATTLNPGDYYWAFHVSTTNSATGGAATTALGNTLNMMVLQSTGTVAHGMRVFGAGTNNSQAAILGQGIISTGATRASIAFSGYTVTGSRGPAAGLFMEWRNATVY